MDFSEKAFLFEKLNKSQENLARALNASYASINRWKTLK